MSTGIHFLVIARQLTKCCALTISQLLPAYQADRSSVRTKDCNIHFLQPLLGLRPKRHTMQSESEASRSSLGESSGSGGDSSSTHTCSARSASIRHALSGGVAGAFSKTCTAPLARLVILYQASNGALVAAMHDRHDCSRVMPCKQALLPCNQAVADKGHRGTPVSGS